MYLSKCQNSNNVNFGDKLLQSPSFCLISNLGGGGSDKYRENVYLDLYQNLPILFNYYYLLNSRRYQKAHGFANIWLRELESFSNFSSFIEFLRNSMIEDKGYFSKQHSFTKFSAHENILILDSGAANIIDNYLEQFDYRKNRDKIFDILIKELRDYYIFANNYDFDIIIGFDIGGKYTFKGTERHDEQIKNGRKHISDEAQMINEFFIEESIGLLKSIKNYQPKIYYPIHGDTPEEFYYNTEKMLEIEKANDFRFDGFALGGIASGLNNEHWGIDKNTKSEIQNINLTEQTGSKIYKTIKACYAARIVRHLIDDRPLHALGAGGRYSVVGLYYSGVNSFDAQTPGRRAYDGNSKSSNFVFDPDYNKSISKYLYGIINRTHNVINPGSKEFNYVKLNKVKNDIDQCGCPSCQLKNIQELKDLYGNKEQSNEDYYYARQLMNAHAVWQHKYLCDALKSSKSFDDFINLFQDTLCFDEIINYIVNEFNYQI